MSTHVAVRDSGETTEEGAMRLWRVSAAISEGILDPSHMEVTEKSGTPDMSVDIAAGDIVVEESDYAYHGWTTGTENVAVDASHATLDRIDRVVAYVDKAVTGSTNNQGALKFMAVAGTPDASPSAPDDSAVQTAVGAGNPFADLAQLDVQATVTSITDSDITDSRVLFRLSGSGGLPPFTLPGDMSVANDLTPQNLMAQPGVITQVYARVKTAPSGASLIFRIKKNGVEVTTVTIASGSNSGNTTGISVSFVAGDYFTIDCTQVGSSTAGANATISMG